MTLLSMVKSPCPTLKSSEKIVAFSSGCGWGSGLGSGLGVTVPPATTVMLSKQSCPALAAPSEPKSAFSPTVKVTSLAAPVQVTVFASALSTTSPTLAVILVKRLTPCAERPNTICVIFSPLVTTFTVPLA